MKDPPARRTGWAVAAGLLLVLGGLAAVAVEAAARPPSLGTAPDDLLHEPGPGVAHNSPTLARHPTSPSVLAVANRVDAPQFGCALAVSTNAGTTWQDLERTPGLAAVDCFWPRVAFDGRGDLLVLYTPLGGPNLLPVGLWLQRYEDLRPAGEPVVVAGDLAFHARMAVLGERVWVTWVQAGPATWDNPLGFEAGDNHIVVARSDDGGRTFQPPVRVSEPDRRVIQPTLLAWGDGAGDGALFVGALDLMDDVLNYAAAHDGETPPDPALRWRIVGWTSGDGGERFGPPVTVADDLVVPQLIIADLAPTPGFARDPASGRLYAVWDAGRGPAERDAFLTWSADGGRTWSPPRPLDPRPGSQVLPAVDVAGDGRVDVVFYDRGNDPDDVLAEVVLATSSDHGDTFRWVTVSDRAIDSRIGLGMQQGVPLLGEHLAVASLPGRAVAFWADTSRGSLFENVQDLVYTVVEMRPGRERRGAVLVAGGVGLAAGIALLAGAALAGRRHRRE
jgi:hypothetical protein